MSAVRVLVVDDHESFRRVAAAVVEATGGFVVAGSVATGEESLVAAAAVEPDLVLMDINLPGMDGLEATRWLRSSVRPPVVILLSTYDEDDFGARARDCGAAAYVVKSAFGTERLAAVWASASDT
ncbi:MAG TPA: response regulator transcription factor [Actinoplanes sp.]|nr:response regulator transcription factor [Actinoplanes sp.]